MEDDRTKRQSDLPKTVKNNTRTLRDDQWTETRERRMILMQNSWTNKNWDDEKPQDLKQHIQLTREKDMITSYWQVISCDEE